MDHRSQMTWLYIQKVLHAFRSPDHEAIVGGRIFKQGLVQSRKNDGERVSGQPKYNLVVVVLDYRWVLISRVHSTPK